MSCSWLKSLSISCQLFKSSGFVQRNDILYFSAKTYFYCFTGSLEHIMDLLNGAIDYAPIVYARGDTVFQTLVDKPAFCR
jgi:hypothetical protein